MKRFIISLLVVMLICSLCFVTACNDDSTPNPEPSGPVDGSNPGGDNQKPNEPSEKATYTVRFIVDDEVYETVTGEEGKRISKPKTNPTKEHMTFEKWEGFTSGARFTEDRDYVAIFKDTIYKIEFVSLDKTVATTEGKYGDTFTVPNDPVAGSNYQFLGWEGLTDDHTIQGDKKFTALWNVKTPEITYTTGSFDASNLNKDTIFTNAAMISEFARVQKPDSNSDPSFNDDYTMYLANDGTYLYIYILSADCVNDDGDRLGFYFAANGETNTSYVETYPNKSEPYSKGKDLCDELICGKVEGGYALKAKIALSKLDVDSENKISLSVRFVGHAEDGSTHFVYLSEGAKADDSSGTKVNSPEHLVKFKVGVQSTDEE